MIRRRLLQGITVSHLDYFVHLAKFHSARLGICTELQLCGSGNPRPDLHGTAKSIPHSRRISRESSERTNLRFYDTHCEVISVICTGYELIAVVFCSVHEGITCRVLGSEVRIRGKADKFSGCSRVVIP